LLEKTMPTKFATFVKYRTILPEGSIDTVVESKEIIITIICNQERIVSLQKV